MKSNNSQKNKIILVSVFTALFTVLLFGGSIAIFSYTKLGTVENKIQTGYLSFDFSEGRTINIENANPVSDKVGKNLAENCTFNITGTAPKDTSIDYTVYATNGGKIGNRQRFKDDEIGIYVQVSGTDETHKVDIADKANGNYTIGDLREVYNKGFVLATGSVIGQDQKSSNVKYTVRMWVSDVVKFGSQDKGHTYTMSKFNNMYYSMKIRVDAN